MRWFLDMAAEKYGNRRLGECKLPPMPARDQRLLIGAAIGTSALLLLAALAGHEDLLAYAAPLFLLAVPLLAGRYVGEDRLERLRGTSVPAPCRRPPVGTKPATRRAAALLPRGGRLIAEALAVRPPPLLAQS
jgi:hypothetical protein